MTKVELPPFVDTQRGRDGVVRYYYFRRNGRRWRLPGTPFSEDFSAEYRRLLAETAPCELPADLPNARVYPAGSMGRLILEYLASAKFHEKRPTTQAEYRRVLERIAAQHGQKPVRLLEPRHIYNMQDALLETPGAANTLVRMLKLVLSFALKRGHIRTNPAARIELLKIGEWRAWTDDECAAFESHWPPGSMERRAYALALYTGQRLSDLVRMTRAHRKDGAIYVAQSKTDKSLWIAEHKNLTVELSLGNGDHMSLLTTSRGKAFDPVYFGAWFAAAIEKAGLPNDCVLHGLRKTAATRLADAGCSEVEIQSVTGQSPAMVAHYIKGRDQRRAARSAISKLERNTK